MPTERVDSSSPSFSSWLMMTATALESSPPGQRRADRHLRLQPQPHRLHEAALVLRGRRVVVGALLVRELEQLLLEPGEHAPLDAVRVGREHLARGEPLDAVEERLGAVLVRAEAQVAVDRALVDLLVVEAARQDRLDLAGEEQHLTLAARVRAPGRRRAA